MIKKYRWILISLIITGVFLRIYKVDEWFLYSHDHDLLGWFIKDVVFNKHLRLIGQETSQHGVFIGPLFYYMVIPFYFLSNWDPIGGTIFVTLLGAFGIWSIWFVFEKTISKFAAFSGALIYATSYALVLPDREVVPTMPVVLWSIWFFYSIHLLFNGKQKPGWLLAGILIGLVWHLNMGLILVTPLAIFAFGLSRKRINLKSLTFGVISALLLMLPFILFEVRHGFIQINAILFSGLESESIGGIHKFDRVMQLVSKNVYRIFFAEIIPIPHLYAFFIAMSIMVFVTLKKIFNPLFMALMWLWIVIYLFFFTYNPIVISEYYLNGMNIIWIAMVSAFLSFLYHTKWKTLSFALLFIFFAINLYKFSIHSVNASGYVERKQIVQEIKEDALEKGYPCVSISYITNPGYELGYRYFIWREGLKTAKISDKVPVYTIVFPHSLVDRIDKSVGALGLIYPDYERYNNQSLTEGCSGEDYNLTYPLFGYTE